MNNEPNLLTVHEAATILNVSKWTIYELVKHGDIQAIRIRSVLRILPQQLKTWIEKGGCQTTEHQRNSH